MKIRSQRKIAIYALVAALFITTVAYAVLQTTLNITGTVTQKGGSWDIHFVNVANITKTGDATMETPTINGGTALTFSPTLVKPLDSIIFTVDVVNDGTIDAKLSALTLTGAQEAKTKDVTYSVTYSDGRIPTEGDTLNVDETRTLLIKVSYDNVDALEIEDLDLNLGATMLYIQADKAVTQPNGGAEDAS